MKSVSMLHLIVERQSYGQRRVSSCYQISLVLLLVLVYLVPSPLLSQQTIPLRVEDVLNGHEFAQLSSAEFSSDGKWLVYADHDNQKNESVTPSQYEKSGVPGIAIGTDIVIVDTETGLTRNLTGGVGANWGAVWSPRGFDLAFLSDRDSRGKGKLWIWHGASGTLVRLSDADINGSEVCWSPDGTKIVVRGSPVKPTGEIERAIQESVVQNGRTNLGAAGTTVTLYSSTPSSDDAGPKPQSNPWNLDVYLADLLLVDAQRGITQTLLTSERIGTFSFSPDSTSVAFSTPLSFEESGSQQLLWSVSVIEIGSGKTVAAASKIRMGFNGASFSWSPDTSRLAFQEMGPKGSGDCYVVDIKTGVSTNITQFGKDSAVAGFRSPLWDDAGEFVYVTRDDAVWRASANSFAVSTAARIPERHIVELVSTGKNRLWLGDGGRTAVALTYDDHGKQSGLYRLNLTSGRVEEFLEQGQFYLNTVSERHVFSSADNRKFAYFSQDSQHDTDLWITDSEFEHPRRLTHLNAQFDKYHLGKARLIEYRSLDGELLHGALLLPADYQKGKQYPLIVWVYGGSRGSDYLNRFGLGFGSVANFQILATRGYAVLFPDALQRLGTPMLDLAKTVLPAVNRVIDMEIADPDRIGIMGHSHGGYSVLSLIVQTKRFRAAIVEDGTGDLITSYGQMGRDGSAFLTSVNEQGQGLMGGTPWQYRERYIENSPVFFLDRVETPVLIVHGGEDTTIAPFLGDEIFVGLRRLGKEVEYARYDGEGHSPAIWRLANQVDLCNRVIAWFDRHLKTGPQKYGGL